MKDINKNGAGESYSFSPYLKDYLEEKLKIEKMRKSTSDAGNQLSVIDERAIKANNKRKGSETE